MNRSPRVLVVDDDSSVREIVSKALERNSIVCELANDGEQAIELLEHGSYSAIVLDLLLPRVDGFGVLDYMLRKGLRTPVVVVTAAGAGRLERLTPLKVKAVVPKPVDLEHLVDTVIALAGATAAAE